MHARAVPTASQRAPKRPNHDLAALYAAATGDMALCTLVGIEGSFSRGLGAQIAVGRHGDTVGSLSDGCLERQLVAEAQAARAEGRSRLLRFGAGSRLIDFRLPCGSGLDILVDPAPDKRMLRDATAQLERRQDAFIPLDLPSGARAGLLATRHYRPSLRIVALGEGPELSALAALGHAVGAEIEIHDRLGAAGRDLPLGRVPDGVGTDPYTAILLLFHDHEWEAPILRWALDTPAFYVGAQGGAVARGARNARLLADGVAPDVVGKIHSPVGLIPRARDPDVLALSVLAEIVAAYEEAKSGG